MVWCRMMYKPCADVKPVVTKIRPEMHVDSLSSSEISLQIIIFHWIECIIRKNQDYVYGICKCKLLGTTEKYFKGIDKWKNFDSLISLDVLKIYDKGRNVNRLSVIMWISYHVNVCVCILYIYMPSWFRFGGGWGCEVSCGGHHRPRGKTSCGWSSVWHRSNTGLSSTQYEQIPIILGVWPFWLTRFFFRSITFWRLMV